MLVDLFLSQLANGLREISPATDSCTRQRALEIAAIGDSLTTGFDVSSPLKMIWRARTRARRNWFLDTSGSVNSVFERLRSTTPVIAYQYSTVSATVDGRSTQKLSDCLLATRHFSEQVTSVKRLPRFPDVVLIWIGHNSLDWIAKANSDDRSNHDSLFERLRNEFIDAFRGQLWRLIMGGATADHRVAIIVFGLIDFSLFFSARENAEEIQKQSLGRYPHLSDAYRYFPSMQPEFRGGMIRLANMMNEGLASLVDLLSKKPSLPRQVSLRFSTALHDTDISSESTLSDCDAWHPSLVGHRLLAQSAYDAIAAVVGAIHESGDGP